MFEIFGEMYSEGSLTGFLLILYGTAVSAISNARRERAPHLVSDIENTSLALIFGALSLPILIWGIVYSIAYLSLLKGSIVWLIGNFLAIASVYALGYSIIPGVHVLLSWMAMGVGLFLTIKAHPF